MPRDEEIIGHMGILKNQDWKLFESRLDAWLNNRRGLVGRACCQVWPVARVQDWDRGMFALYQVDSPDYWKNCGTIIRKSTFYHARTYEHSRLTTSVTPFSHGETALQNYNSLLSLSWMQR